MVDDPDIANFIKTFTGPSGPISSAARSIRWARAHRIFDRRSGIPGGALNTWRFNPGAESRPSPPNQKQGENNGWN
jgi:hypothetical protein